MFHITNETSSAKSDRQVVFSGNNRCDQENIISQLKACGALAAPLDNLESNWAYMVIASLSWSLKAWCGLIIQPEGPKQQKAEQSKSKRQIIRMEFRQAEVLSCPCREALSYLFTHSSLRHHHNTRCHFKIQTRSPYEFSPPRPRRQLAETDLLVNQQAAKGGHRLSTSAKPFDSRYRQALLRCGISICEGEFVDSEKPETVLALDEALTKFESLHPRKAAVWASPLQTNEIGEMSVKSQFQSELAHELVFFDAHSFVEWTHQRQLDSCMKTRSISRGCSKWRSNVTLTPKTEDTHGGLYLCNRLVSLSVLQWAIRLPPITKRVVFVHKRLERAKMEDTSDLSD